MRRCRSGDRTAVWVPDEGSEAAKQDQLRARHRLSEFLLHTGQWPATGMKAWTLDTWSGSVKSFVYVLNVLVEIA